MSIAHDPTRRWPATGRASSANRAFGRKLIWINAPAQQNVMGATLRNTKLHTQCLILPVLWVFSPKSAGRSLRSPNSDL
jgi:hypothetical protein